MANPTDEASVHGLGREELLPARGNPFAAPAAPAPIPDSGDAATNADAVGAAALDQGLRDLTPEDVAEMFGMTLEAEAPAPEPVAIPATSAPSATEPAPSASVPTGRPTLPTAAASLTEALAARMSGDGGRLSAGPAFPPTAADLPAESPGSGWARNSGTPWGADPSSAADTSDAAASTPPAGDGAALPTKLQTPGSELGGSNAPPIPPPLQEDRQLVSRYLVTDARLIQLWNAIDKLEDELTASEIDNIRLVQDLLNRLQTARNYLMADRMHFEEAERQVAEVRYRKAMALRVRQAKGPRRIFAYLMFCLAVLVAGFAVSPAIAARVEQGFTGTAFLPLWFTLLWGGIGGVTGAMYAMWVHASRDQDYDSQFDLWYYTNPIMGVVLGAFAFLIMRAGVVSILGGTEPSGLADTATLVYYLMAWLVGFQQNLAFSLANAALRKFIPQKEPEAKDSGAEALKVSEAVTGAPK